MSVAQKWEPVQCSCSLCLYAAKHEMTCISVPQHHPPQRHATAVPFAQLTWPMDGVTAAARQVSCIRSVRSQHPARMTALTATAAAAAALATHSCSPTKPDINFKPPIFPPPPPPPSPLPPHVSGMHGSPGGSFPSCWRRGGMTGWPSRHPRQLRCSWRGGARPAGRRCATFAWSPVC